MKKILFLPLLLTLLVGCSSKDKTFIERRDDCAEFIGHKITIEDFIKKHNLLSREGFEVKNMNQKYEIIANFCSFYRLGSNSY